jgi:hypothetical protein
MVATARLNLARLLRGTGERATAVSLLRDTVEWYDRSGGGDGALLSRCLLAAETDDQETLEEVLTLAGAAADRQVVVLTLDALARLSGAAGDPGRATELIAEADALHPAVAHLLDDADRVDRAAALRTMAPSAEPSAPA